MQGEARSAWDSDLDMGYQRNAGKKDGHSEGSGFRLPQAWGLPRWRKLKMAKQSSGAEEGYSGMGSQSQGGLSASSSFVPVQGTVGSADNVIDNTRSGEWVRQEPCVACHDGWGSWLGMMGGGSRIR
ncbi:hypothetical protein IAQ61_008492 [Plenodomus lingam]|uniref:uncharacterized protein n=1 Tax=Leptosphaeria maculans TaxID=5022 RepID=UPI003323CF13|nr:hypothetical protein IAQ61_008492 [Plenodomus lingam]